MLSVKSRVFFSVNICFGKCLTDTQLDLIAKCTLFS